MVLDRDKSLNMLERRVMVSVLLPAYNAEKYIAKAIESILAQTYTNFEFIIINDGSIDSTKEIIQSFKDPRIVYVENEKNSGLIYTLNRGLALAKGKYIARMDADDISLPTRFEKQLRMMESDNDIIVCGTQVLRFSGSSSGMKKQTYFTQDLDIKKNMILGSPFAHPTVFIRKEVLVKNNFKYDSNFKDAEDYKLWADLMSFGKFCNLKDYLLKYRISETQITQSNNYQQKNSAKRVRRLIYKISYGVDCPSQINLHTIDGKKRDKQQLVLFFLSLDKYDIKAIFKSVKYFILCRIDLKTLLRIFKRFVKHADPLI